MSPSILQQQRCLAGNGVLFSLTIRGYSGINGCVAFHGSEVVQSGRLAHRRGRESDKSAPTSAGSNDHCGIRTEHGWLVGCWAQPWVLRFVRKSSNASVTKSLMG